MKPVTAWYKMNPISLEMEFNHLEDGHVVQESPTTNPKYPDQAKAWANQTWVSVHRYLGKDNKLCDLPEGE